MEYPEYKVIESSDSSRIQEELNRNGRQGWILDQFTTTVEKYSTYYVAVMVRWAG